MTTARTTVSKKTATSKTSSDKPAPRSRTSGATTPKSTRTGTPEPAPATTAATSAAKPRAPRKSASAKADKPAITPEQRYQLIAMAAYYRAEQRGFARGGELDDWIAAEKEIEAMLKS